MPQKHTTPTDYNKSRAMGLTNTDRWERGIEHHSMSERLMAFLSQHDFNDYEDYFCWKTGGDGDNGETLMYQMDAFFEMLEVADTDTRRDRAALLEAAQHALSCLNNCVTMTREGNVYNSSHEKDALRAAIAKAKGE